MRLSKQKSLKEPKDEPIDFEKAKKENKELKEWIKELSPNRNWK